jgi:hypothetical protein
MDVNFLTRCMAGHDLTEPGAYVYSQTGIRSCRACQQPKKKGKGDGFTDSWMNQYSESPREKP